MDEETAESIYFRYHRDLNGQLTPIDTIRQNGRCVPRFDPAWSHPPLPYSDPYESRDYRETVEEVCYGLTERQREVFLTLADSETISETARRCGITRPAIHDFLRRMSARNDYVAIWLARHKRPR